MDGDRHRRAIDLFKHACILDAAARPAFLEAECAGDVALRSHVEALLAEDSRSLNPFDITGGGVPLLARQFAFLESDSVRQSPNDESQGRAVLPVLAGDYRILRVIGEGGMGTVYEAEQAIPRRRVALKAIRPGTASKELMRRFEHEAHILGRLHHPGIAQIYEAGAADVDHPSLAFIAMEYVAGLPLTDHAAARKLGIRERVELVIKVCDAVHHAHQRGVIHRDLKPTNILVDESGQPKVLDFGVARAIGGDEEAMTTMHTVAGQLVGTIVYMSPEQVGGDPNVVDLRSDVYTLGVILFRLLTGRFPYELSQRSMPEMARIIREAPPLRLGEINRELRGDLETIVARSIDKDAERRYQSADDLQSDLQAYLDGAPIEARRDSALYVLRKNLHRYKVAASAASLVLVVSVAASVALMMMWRESKRQAALAREAQTAAQVAEGEQREQADFARAEARKAARINQFLQTVLTSADPNQTRGREVSVRELLDQHAAHVHEELGDEPEIEAAVRTTFGETYATLGNYELADAQLREALAIRRRLLGNDDIDTARTEMALVRVMRDTERLEGAIELCEHSLKTLGRVSGHDNFEYARALMMYGDLLHLQRPAFKEAENAYLEAIAIVDRLYGRKNRYTAAVLGNLGAMYIDLFKYQEAEPVLREAYEIARDIYGAAHSVTVMNGHNYATVLQFRNKSKEAESLVRAVLDGAKTLYGPDHPETARAKVLLAELLWARGESAEAEPLARQALAARRARLPENHRLTIWAQVLLADVLAAKGTPESAVESETLMRGALDVYGREGRSEHWPAFEAQSVLGASLAAQGRFDEAEPLLLASLDRLKLMQGPASRAVRSAVLRIIRMYDAWGKIEPADDYRMLLANLPTR